MLIRGGLKFMQELFLGECLIEMSLEKSSSLFLFYCTISGAVYVYVYVCVCVCVCVYVYVCL